MSNNCNSPTLFGFNTVNFATLRSSIEMSNAHPCKAAYVNLEFPVFEQFCFRRIVFDEFHEADSFGSKEVHGLVNLKSLSTWGLTGTPQQKDARAVVAAASLFGVDLAGQDAGEAAFANKVAFCSRKNRDVLVRETKKNPQFCLEDVPEHDQKAEARNVRLERLDEYSVVQKQCEEVQRRDHRGNIIRSPGHQNKVSVAAGKVAHSSELKMDAKFWPCAGCGERNPLPNRAGAGGIWLKTADLKTTGGLQVRSC